MSDVAGLQAVDLPIDRDPGLRAPLDAAALERGYLELMEAQEDADAASHAAGDDYLAGTNALYHGDPVQWSFVPKIYSLRDLGYLAWIAETMGGIMEKTTRAYVECSEVREAFGLDPRVEALVLAPQPYGAQIPIARVDVFLDDETGDFQFCELNTDGSAGMLTTTEVTRACALTRTGRRFIAEKGGAAAFDLYAGCARAVLESVAEAGGGKACPRIAAVDYAESIVAEEIEEFSRVFDELGAELHFSDIRDLAYRGGVLSDALGPLDGVWRRVVVSEMLEKPCSGADALMCCALEGGVPIVGGFKTWPCATKTVFAVLHAPIAESFLDEDEMAFVRAHVPKTVLLDPVADLSAYADKDAWIVKPADGYNSIGVRAGRDCSEAEWGRALAVTAAGHGIVQAYAPQHGGMNVEGGRAGAGRRPELYNQMVGLFLFNGRFGGVFTRCGLNAVIGEFSGRLNMGCLVVG